MEPFRYHVFVCEQRKPEGLPCCAARGGASVLEALRREVAVHKLSDDVQVTACGSLGLCESGPNMVVYPEGVWYSGVRVEDVGEIVQSHFVDGAVVERLARADEAGTRAEIVGNREKMMAGMRAREAAGVPPDDLMQTVRGFQESRALLTALELDVFTAVGEGAMAREVAARAGADPRAMEMLLHALAAMGLLTKHDGTFRNSADAARFFAAASPHDSRLALLHSAHLWHRWSTLTDCVKAGTAVARDRGRGEEWTRAFIAAMHRNARERAPQLVNAVGAPGIRRMLDVGGGSGAYSIAFALANGTLEADVLDRPEVLALAAEHIREAGVGDRVHMRPGDLVTDDLGSGYDLVLISAICHMLDPAENVDLFRRSRAALVRGGRVAVQDFILEPDKTAPRFAAVFALNMLVGTRGGSSYSGPEYRQWLETAGFTAVRQIRLPGPAGMIVAVNP